jgi:hypothetical protein
MAFQSIFPRAFVHERIISLVVETRTLKRKKMNERPRATSRVWSMAAGAVRDFGRNRGRGISDVEG